MFYMRVTEKDNQETEIEQLRRQLEATFHELESVKRQQAESAHPALPSLPPPINTRSLSFDTHARPPTPASVHQYSKANTPMSALSRPPTPQSMGGRSQQQQQQQQQHGQAHTAASPHSVASASSVRSSMTASTLGLPSAVAPGVDEAGYQGDLHYISSLGAIQEEGSVMTVNSQGSTVRRSQVGASTPSSVPQSEHLSQQREGIAATAEASSNHSYHNHSVRSEYSQAGAATAAGVASTPIHSLLRTAYEEGAAPSARTEYGAEEEEERHLALDEAIHKQLQSLTATNTALTARTTQLEQRLRHSELRCKLLMDQIKSMPVSLSVAQVSEKYCMSRCKYVFYRKQCKYCEFYYWQ